MLRMARFPEMSPMPVRTLVIGATDPAMASDSAVPLDEKLCIFDTALTGAAKKKLPLFVSMDALNSATKATTPSLNFLTPANTVILSVLVKSMLPVLKLELLPLNFK